MLTLTINKENYQVSPQIALFVDLLKSLDEDVPNIQTVINEFQTFLTAWKDFKRSKKEPAYQGEHFKRFHIFHTIKPNTQYAHQQEYAGKQPRLYPVYSFSKERVNSAAPGGNYPIAECNFYIGDGQDIVPFQRTKK